MGNEWPWPGYQIPDCFGDRGMFCLDDCVVSCPVSEDCKNAIEEEEEGMCLAGNLDPPCSECARHDICGVDTTTNTTITENEKQPSQEVE